MAIFILKQIPHGPETVIAGVVTVGRNQDNTLRLIESKISRYHARLTLSESAVFVEDLASSNGTFVNNRRIEANKPVRLNSGDRLRFDHDEFEFRAPSGYPTRTEVRYSEASARPSAWSEDPQGSKTVGVFNLGHRSVVNAPPPKKLDAAKVAAAAPFDDRAPSGKSQLGSMDAPFEISPAVHYTLTTSKRVRIGSVFLLDVWAHLAKDADAVRAMVERSLLDQQIIIHKPNRLLGTIPAGAVLEARVHIPALGVDQWGVIFWNDSIGHASYVIRVPEANAPGTISGTVHIAVNEILICDIAFEINLSADSRDLPVSHYPRQSAKRLKSAFASFAEQDEEQVSTRVQGILAALPDLDLFLEATRIRREPRWNDILSRELSMRDRFYLFWSRAAKESPWVAQEWRTALALKGIDAIHPVPLVSPTDVPPPEELEEIAFKKWKLPAAVKHQKKNPQDRDELPPGVKIGHYEISRSLSRGGFGITYRARDLRLNREVALKEYFPLAYAYRGGDNHIKPKDNPQDREIFGWGLIRFSAEAQSLARFRHPNILGVMDHIEQNSTAYLITPLETGKTLDQWGAAAAWDEEFLLSRILLPLLGGLSSLHAQKLLHRDIKPQNIIVRDVDNSPVLVDFGSSRLVATSRPEADDTPLTTVVSVGYSPPEQHQGHRQGPFTDIYAFSATVYHVISGSIPPDAMGRLAGADFARHDVDLIRERCSPQLARAIFQGLNLRAERRPQSVAEFVSLLTPAATESNSVNAAEATPYYLKAIACGVAGACLFALLAMIAARYFHWNL